MSQATPPDTSGEQRDDLGRLRRLTEAFVAVNASLSLEETIEHVTEKARELVDAHQAATSFTVGSDWTQAISSVSQSAKYAERGEYRGAPGGSRIYRFVCERNEPMRLTQAELEAHPAWRGLPDTASHPSMRGWLAVPLVGRDGKNLGIVQVSDRQEGEFTAEDEAILLQLAQLASVALEKASLYQREREAARTLQQRLLPEEMPRVGQLDIAVRYLPGGQGTAVGGDWYDVVELGEHEVGLIIGDVMGRGVAAASVMGQLRVALRAYAMESMPPGQALDALDRLVATLGGEYLVTVVYARWNLRSGTLTFASAGHLAPLLRLPEGEVMLLEGDQGLPIGVAPDLPHHDHRVVAPPGAVLLMFTDGLIEHRDLPIDTTLEAVMRAASASSTPLQAGYVSAEAVAQRVLASVPPNPEDDVALLVARRAGGSGGPASPPYDWQHRLGVGARPDAVGHARHWVLCRLAEHGLASCADNAALAVSEMVTNAVLHAETELQLDLGLRDRTLRIEVRDRRPVVPSVAAFDPESSGGRGMGLIAALSDEWGVDVDPKGKTVWCEIAAEPRSGG